MRENEIQPGVVLRHVPTQAVYRIEALGKIRHPDGEWVEAARYVNILRPEGNRPEYYRPLSDFGSFALEVEVSSPHGVSVPRNDTKR